MLTIEELTKAFELWEHRYREQPQGFMSHAESQRMAVAAASEGRAVYFTAILRELGYDK